MNKTLEDALAAIDDLTARIVELEAFAEAHQTGAAERQAEIDRLQSEQAKQAWAARTGRRL